MDGGRELTLSSFVSAMTMVVPDYDEAIAFYVDVLSFELREDVDLGEGKRG